MDMVWNRFLGENDLKTQIGQALIEYVFLMAVVVGLFYSFFTSRQLQDFSDDMFNKMIDSIQFSYQHGAGLEGSTYRSPSYDKQPHPTYFVGGNESHFFISHESYPP